MKEKHDAISSILLGDLKILILTFKGSVDKNLN